MAKVFEKDGFVIDLSDWKMRHKNAYLRKVNEAVQSGDESTMYEENSKIVKQWPFDYAGDPGVVESYDELELYDWRKVQEMVGEAIAARFRGN